MMLTATPWISPTTSGAALALASTITSIATTSAKSTARMPGVGTATPPTVSVKPFAR